MDTLSQWVFIREECSLFDEPLTAKKHTPAEAADIVGEPGIAPPAPGGVPARIRVNAEAGSAAEGRAPRAPRRHRLFLHGFRGGSTATSTCNNITRH